MWEVVLPRPKATRNHQWNFTPRLQVSQAIELMWSTDHWLYRPVFSPCEISDICERRLYLYVDFKKAFNIVNHNILFAKVGPNLNTLIQVTVCSLLRWFASYLFQRCQRVRVGSQVSSWKTLSGSMPRGSRLGPLSFIVMIDDLRANCEVHKFVDDTTLSELIIQSGSPSNSSLLIWTANNDMQLNTSKTKKMILGRIDPTSIPSLSAPTGPI